MNWSELLVSILFTGTAYAMVLYVISVGLSVTMGLLGIANLAHGAFAMAGGYLLIELLGHLSLPFAVALVVTGVLVAAVSVVLERLLYVHVYKAGEFDQVLLSMGIIFVASAAAQYIYGPMPMTVTVPASLGGGVELAGRSFSLYRLFLIGVGVATFVALLVAIERTSIGVRIRATVDNRAMAESIGINTGALFSIVFALGSGLAAIGGGLGADMISVAPGYPLEHLAYFLIVVSVGGLGTVSGPFAAALLLGIGDSACKILAPQFGAFFIYVAVFAVLLVRPQGLFGRLQVQ
ncbi:branched-chain amino acid ABC transporter permease [Bradyrhizobium sp.]|uniref:branched-chain amino acid ABC transporter permease n=1 Tax=Bradyrhizobium sp. TaxID=376 RepID=UPI003C6778BE